MSDDLMSVVLAALSDIQSTMVTREHLAGLRNDLADLITNLVERVNCLTEQVSRLEKQQTGLRVDLMARMDRMQATLDQVKSDITVNFRQHGSCGPQGAVGAGRNSLGYGNCG